MVAARASPRHGAPRSAVALRSVQRCKGGQQISDAIEASAGEGAQILVLSFSLSRCGPCKLMDPKVDELANDFDGKAKFIKIVGDTDPDGQDLMTQFGIRAVPAYQIFTGGVKVHAIMGAKYNKLRRKLQEYA